MSGNSFDPVLLGLVRRAVPNIIAQQIIGVQPMTGPSASIFSMRARFGVPSCPMFGVIMRYHVDIPLERTDEFRDMVAWADENLWESNQSQYGYEFYSDEDGDRWRWSFKKVEDATLFKLRWYEGT